MNLVPSRTPVTKVSSRFDTWGREQKACFAAPRMACGAFLALLLWIPFLSVEGCNEGQKEGAKTALDVANMLCIIANAAMPDNKVAEVCGITTPFLQPMKDLLSAHREKVAAARNMGCESPDAGKK